MTNLIHSSGVTDGIPDNPVVGHAHFNPATHELMVWTGTQWVLATSTPRRIWYLFVDDERQPADAGWHSGDIVVARSSNEALTLVERSGLPDAISFDHDLGGEDTAFKFMWALINGHMDKKWDLSTLQFIQIHTANSIGREKLTKLWENFCRTQEIISTIKQVWPQSPT